MCGVIRDDDDCIDLFCSRGRPRHLINHLCRVLLRPLAARFFYCIMFVSGCLLGGYPLHKFRRWKEYACEEGEKNLLLQGQWLQSQIFADV